MHQSSRLAAHVELPVWKRALDLSCILAASPLLIPLGVLLAAAIKIISPGPALFRQVRVGYLGRMFTCLKLRTMAVNADTCVHQGYLDHLISSDNPMIKLDAEGDPRLIAGGVWLRALGLDELPQVINVLRGEMSLVGPRPCLPYEYRRYSPRHRHRCDTLPGLTGLWQVSGKNNTTFEEMMDLDLFYARHRSLWLDLKIIAQTIPAIVAQFCEMRLKKSRAARQKIVCDVREIQSLEEASGNAIISTDILNK